MFICMFFYSTHCTADLCVVENLLPLLICSFLFSSFTCLCHASFVGELLVFRAMT